MGLQEIYRGRANHSNCLQATGESAKNVRRNGAW